MSPVRFRALFLVVLLVVSIGADEPILQFPVDAELSSIPDQDPQTTDQIQKALQGKKIETGYGILDDMLDVLQKRGSILDGSSLDENSSESSPAADPGRSLRSNRLRAAESLLKSARLLEKLGKLDSKQQDLAVQMRRLAVELLTADEKAVVQ